MSVEGLTYRGRGVRGGGRGAALTTTTVEVGARAAAPSPIVGPAQPAICSSTVKDLGEPCHSVRGTPLPPSPPRRQAPSGMVTPGDTPRAAVSLSSPDTVPSWPLCQRDRIPAPSLILPRSPVAAVPARAHSGHVSQSVVGLSPPGRPHGKVLSSLPLITWTRKTSMAPSRPRHVGLAEQCINTRREVTRG